MSRPVTGSGVTASDSDKPPIGGLSPVTVTADGSAEVSGIEAALDSLLATIFGDEAERRELRRERREALRAPFSIGEGLLRLLNGSEVELAAEQIVRDPVGSSCRQSIRALGARLYQLGGLQLMQDVLYRVAERDEATWSRRIGIMDHRWDGIGNSAETAGWMA
jgi:hypothetical protein